MHVCLWLTLPLTLLLAQAGAQEARAPREARRQWSIVEQVPGSSIPMELIFVRTHDAIYTPIALRKPAGNGPFPIVLFFSGAGGSGMDGARNGMLNSGYAPDRFLDAGYVVAWVNYRMEVPGTFYRQATALPQQPRGRLPRPPLDHEDLISVVAFVRNLPYVDAKRVGLVGSSHGGEMILKVASETAIGAGVLCEPAAADYLAVDRVRMGPGERQLQSKTRVVELADKSEAMGRIRKIGAPMLVIGRDSDHNQGTFQIVFDWLIEAGKDAQWVTYDHPQHGFVLPSKGRDGRYKVDAMQEAALARVMKFFGEKMGPAARR